MAHISLQVDLLPYISEYRRNKIVRYRNEQDCKRSLLTELLMQKVIIDKTGVMNTVIYRKRYRKERNCGLPYRLNIFGGKGNTDYLGLSGRTGKNRCILSDLDIKGMLCESDWEGVKYSFFLI